MSFFLFICYAVAIEAAPPTCYDVATTVTNSWTCRNCFNLFVSIDMSNIISQAKWDRQIYITFQGQPELIKFAGPVIAIDPQFGSTNVYKVSFLNGHEFGDGKITFNAEFSGSESKVNSAWACPTRVTLDVGTCSSGTWSTWKDRDDPSGNCDCEEMGEFTQDEGFGDSGLCSNPTGTQARVKGAVELTTTENVRFGLNGLRCWNIDQADRKCKDYEVRFCCAPPVEEAVSCDLTSTGILELQSDGATYDYGNDYFVRLAATHPATGEELHNKAKFWKGQGLLKHRIHNVYSDAWVSCKDNKKSSYLMKCFTDGRLEINGKTGSEITLPLCGPIGCDPTELSQFNTKEYDLSDGCKKGYIVVDGVKLEQHNNSCIRKRGHNLETLSRKKIKCVCDHATRSCGYKVNVGEIGWINWKSIQESYDVSDDVTCKTRYTYEWDELVERPNLTCQDADGVTFVSTPEELVFQKIIGFPEGARCSEPRPCEEHFFPSSENPYSTCQCRWGTIIGCDRENNCKMDCYFDRKRLSTCYPNFCYTRTDKLFELFELLHDIGRVCTIGGGCTIKKNDEPYKSNFDPVLECDTTLPEGSGTASGGVPIGESCFLKCKKGFKLAEHNQDTFKLTCEKRFAWSAADWDIALHHYNDLARIPKCIPE